MRSLQRRAGIACILGAVALLLLTVPASADNALHVIDSGSSDDLVAPPTPQCNDLLFLTDVTFSPAGVPIETPRFGVGTTLVTSFVVPNFPPVGPGRVNLDQVTTFDGHTGRDIWPGQPNEQVQLQFLLNGVPQATTSFTPDLPDGTKSAWMTVDMGTYDLPNGADELRIVHIGDPGSTNSVMVTALCGRHEPYSSTPTTQDPSTTTTQDPSTTTTQDPSTTTTQDPNTTTTQDPNTTTTQDPDAVSTTSTTVAQTTPTVASTSTTDTTTTTVAAVTTTSEVTTEVRGVAEENTDQLAATGVDNLPLILIATGLIMLGSVLLMLSKEPDELVSS